MNIVSSLLTEPNVKKILIEKENVISEETNENSRQINLNVSIKIIYDDSCGECQENVTVKDYLEYWLYDFKSNELKSSSFDRKEQTIKYQVLPYIGDITLHRLKSEDIQHMINKLKQKYSYSTVKKAYECIKGCLQFAVNKRELSFNVADCVILPKNIQRKKSSIRFFNQEQIQIIEEEAVKCYKNGKRIYRIGEIIIFLLNVGLRIGEALALEWSDIDFDKKYVKIRKNVVFVKVRDESNSSYNYHIVEQNAPKTKSGNRIVPLNSAALKALKSLYAINGKHKYVFSTSNGNRVYPRNVDRMFRSVLKKCCIKPTGVHTLRHTFASRLFAKSVDVKTVSELLGHSEVSITYDTYIHLIQEQHVVAVETLEDLYNVL